MIRHIITSAAVLVAVGSGLGAGVASAAPATSFGEGQYRVGIDIYPGIYHTGNTEDCYWERQSGFSGEFEDIIANDFSSGPQTVQIMPGDTAFESRRCGTWVMQPPPPAPSIFGS